MVRFIHRLIEDGTYAVIRYIGNEEEVTVPDYGGRLTVIFDDMFKGHVELKKVRIPPTVTDIGGFVFDGCNNLKEIELPRDLCGMWQYAFARCGINSVDIPGGVGQIIAYTFKDCKNLRRVVCHPGMKKIFAYAFEGCENLETVTVPADTVIDEHAFDGCPETLSIIRV